MISVLIVDDQEIYRDSIKFIIEQDSEIEVVGFAGNGNEALELCKKLIPDVILMDTVMPVCDGIEGTKLIKAYNPSIKVIMLATFSDEKTVLNALNSGANGHILKDIKPQELIFAIKSTTKYSGILHLNPLNSFEYTTGKLNKQLHLRNDNSVLDLAENELSIIKLVVDGKNHQEIASKLYLSEEAVKSTIGNILEKLNLKDCNQLAVFAAKKNII